MKLNKFLLLISIVMVLLFSISLVSASTDSDNLTLSNNTDNTNHLESYDDSVVGLSNSESYSSNIYSEELKSNENNWVINQRNYKMFFDDTNTLKSEYGGQILTFNGEFNNKGTITINSPNTKITGKNTLFNNTVFNLKAEGIMLTNLNFVCDSEFANNEYSCIYICADNVTVYNNNIQYNVPHNVTGFGIYANGLDEELHDVKIVNNKINYHGDALTGGYNYGIVLTNTRDAIVSDNNITCSLPLRAVDWMAEIYGGISMDSVAALAADSCNNLRVSNNYIKTTVNGVAQGEPTLDTVLIYACHNSTIEKNKIFEYDYVTKKGDVNYLYGLDLYLSNDVVIYGNDIHIRTSGGKEAHGTAYPIQVTGQAKNILIAFNNISSYSNGPNIGIYSQNYYGITQLDIISNYINVTGFASAHSWALVAGIEVQDSDDKILNNTIIVNTVNEFKTGYNVYGISYSQKTNGDHHYDIQYNNVKSNGDYAVALKSGGSDTVSNSIIANNILNARKYGGNRAAYIGGGSGNTIVNNTDGSKPVRKMTTDEYTNKLKNYLGSPFKGNGLSLGWLNGNGNTIGAGDNNGGNSLNGNSHGIIAGNNPNKSQSQSQKGDLNSTHYTYGSSGIDIASASSSSGSGGSSGSQADDSNLKSYEVTKKIESPNYIQAIIFIIITLILLIIGYKRNNSTVEE